MKFKSDTPNICLYCEFSSPLNDDGFVICKRRGVVTADHTCRHFFPDLIKMPVEITAIPQTPDDISNID